MSLTSKSNRNARKLRIVFLGEQGVGKTSIIERYSSGCFDENYNATVGIDFNVKDVTKNGNLYRLQMWDTAGQERYRSLIPTYLKSADAVVFVFDLTKTKSLDKIVDWYKLFSEHQEAPGILVGNKTDLSNARKIQREQAEKLSKDFNLEYIEVSAKTGKKVDDLFECILNMIVNRKENLNLFEPDCSKKNLEKVNLEQFEKKVELKESSFLGKIRNTCCSS